MREIRLSGSVRGADREVRPYRDHPNAHAKHGRGLRQQNRLPGGLSIASSFYRF
jgi:hypothetical protein